VPGNPEFKVNPFLGSRFAIAMLSEIKVNAFGVVKRFEIGGYAEKIQEDRCAE
jgi:hypothetical protein